MREFLRNIWKTQPADKRPPWKVFCEKVRSGEIQIMRKKDFLDKAREGKNIALDKKNGKI